MKASDTALQDRASRLGIRDADLRIVCTRARGPGGQHVNKVETRITITHVPTGLSANASDSRSQSMNRKLALERLLDLFEQQQTELRQQRLAEVSKARRQKAKRSRGTKAKILEGKRRRAETKKLRGRVST